MELRFGHDFSQVRAHTNAQAAESAHTVNAHAFTVQHDIVFGAGQYRPQTFEGRRLLAHELVHVVQQASLPTTALPTMQRSPAEREPFPSWVHLPQPLQAALNLSSQNNVFDRCPAQAGVDLEACFNRLDHAARFLLLSLYRELDWMGLWSHVHYIAGVWTEGSGGVRFVASDSKALTEAILANVLLCRDTGLGGILHKGTSFREVSTAAGLHLTLGAAGHFTAHVDKISPVAYRDVVGGTCVYDPTRSVAHIGREVVSGAVPGLEIFPEPAKEIPGKIPEREAPPPEVIRWTISNSR